MHLLQNTSNATTSVKATSTAFLDHFNWFLFKSSPLNPYNSLLTLQPGYSFQKANVTMSVLTLKYSLTCHLLAKNSNPNLDLQGPYLSPGLTSHYSLHAAPNQPHHPPLSSLNTLPPTWRESFAQVPPSVCDTHLLSWPRYLLLFLQVTAQNNFLKMSFLVKRTTINLQRLPQLCNFTLMGSD